jgi:hypothetical protein
VARDGVASTRKGHMVAEAHRDVKSHQGLRRKDASLG